MKSILGMPVLVAIAAGLFSFSAHFGGEGFEITLNGKTILQKFGKEMDNVNVLKISQVSAKDVLTIKYHHCGKVAKQRVVTIKDGQDNVLTQLRFADDSKPYTAMSFSLKDIVSLKKNQGSTLKIYYASSELPGGRLLTSIVSGNNSLASK